MAKEKEYYVTFRIDARHTVKVTADSMENAKREARFKFDEADFGELSDFVDSEIVTVEDSRGRFLYES